MKNLFAFTILVLFIVQSHLSLAQTELYNPMYTGDNFGSEPIDTELPVGHTPGAASVSLSGGASYNIPIALLPGTNGVSPQVSLVYSNQSGNGLMGTGWAVSGLSIIHRGSQNWYFDDKVGPESLSGAPSSGSPTGPLLIDGQRLIVTNGGVYGDDQTTYGSESETFSLITSHGTLGNGPEWFSVEMKNGTVYEYGKTSNSRLEDQGTGTVILWRLNRVIDLNGNYIDYNYLLVNNQNLNSEELLIDEILYTGNLDLGHGQGDLAPYNRVKFHYSDGRLDPNIGYIDGISLSTSKLLTGIEITGENGAAFKRYNLDYGNDGLYSYLIQLTEYGSDDDHNTRLNSTKFKYGDSSQEFTSISTSDVATANWKNFAGDFNGDGLTDIITAKEEVYNQNNQFFKYFSQLKYWEKNKSNNNFTYKFQTNLPTTYSYINDTRYPVPQKLFISDFDGDGKADLLIEKRVYESGYWKLKSNTIYSINSQSNGFATQTHNTSVSNSSGSNSEIIYPDQRNYQYVGDFDGDSRADYLTNLSNGTGYRIYLSFPGKNSLNHKVNGAFGGASSYFGSLTTADQVRVLDWDGDGKSELMITSKDPSSGTKIYTFSKNGAGDYEAVKLYDAGYPTEWHNVFTGDFNGDGKTDFLTGPEHPTISTNWQISYSTGSTVASNSFVFSEAPDIQVLTTNGAPNDIIHIGDFNGDGKDDIFHAEGSRTFGFFQNVDFHIYYSNGLSFEEKTIQPGHDIPVSWPLTFGDFNGDGQEDFYYFRTPNSNDDKLYFFREKDQSRIIDKISDGFNRITDFDYDRMTSTSSSFYSAGTNSSFPLNDLKVPGWLVSTVAQPDGLGGSKSINYSYEEAILHRKGKGFLGFGKVHSINLIDDIESESSFTLDPVFYTFVPSISSASQHSTNIPISQSVFSYNMIDLGDKRFQLQLEGAIEGDAERQRNITKVWEYDAFGNVILETVDVQNGLEVTITSHVYGQYGTWIPAHPEQTTVTKLRDIHLFTHTTTRTFNGKGQLSSEIIFDGLPKSVTTAYTYDPVFGNITNETISAAGQVNRTTDYTYELLGRFQETETKGQILTTTATYDPLWGKPISITNPDGLTTINTFDNYGRLIQKVDPDNNTSVININWGGTGLLTELYSISTSTPGKPVQRIWYDILERETKKEKEGFGNYWVQTTTTYDAKGNMASKTLPHQQGWFVETTSFSYDYKNRVISASNNNGTTAYTYTPNPMNGYLTIAVTPPSGQVVTTVQDPSDVVISKTDNGGTLHFEHDALGNQIKVRLGATELSSMQYDQYGKQTQLVDKNGGTTTYTYNAFGELETQTDANGLTQSVFYDNLGRTSSRVTPEGSTMYQYVSNGNGEGNIEKEIVYDPSGTPLNIEKEYNYNSEGRVSQIIETIDGVGHSTQFTYDPYGNLEFTVYPSGFGTKNEFSSKGYLTKVTNSGGGTTLFDATSGTMDDFGHYTQYGLGNGKQTSNQYNTFGIPLQFQTSGIRNLQMNFNLQTGNLTSRYDQIKGKTETFTYDNLNRLTSAQVNGLTIQNYGFSTNGNLTSKSDAGVLSYHNLRMNAVVSATDPNNLIPSFQQDISYNSYQDPISINENGEVMTFTYGPDRNRWKSERSSNGVLDETRYYFGSYEKLIKGGSTKHIHYIAGGDGLCAIVIRENGQNTYNYVYTDHLGSITHVTDDQGTLIAEQNFDAWGRKRNPTTWDYTNIPTVPDWLYRGYTGHEHLVEFGIIHMNGRLYDPVLGRMLSVDNYVHSQLGTQGYNRYSYAGNNPLRFVDPGGEVPILAAMLTGAVIGAATSGAIYSVAALATGNWNLGQFGRAVLLGGVGGALGGALGYVGAASGFGQSLAYNVLSNFSANTATTLAFGNDITLGSMAGFFAGGILGGYIGGFNGVEGGTIANIGAELATSAAKGALTGMVSGGVSALIDGENIAQGIFQGAKNGIISHMIMSAVTIGAFGAAFVPRRSYGNFGKYKPVYRRGTFITKLLSGAGTGVSLGRNQIINKMSDADFIRYQMLGGSAQEYNDYLTAHETAHYAQQRAMGFGSFYFRTIGQYLKYGAQHTYGTPGTLEYAAEGYAFKQVGYYYDGRTKRTSFP